ncbi:hypothetical protein CYV26_12685 [Carnobacterium maltaromaticum]|nr:hypothetical protein CYV30_14875 [Carnobacterium maltaromaticum]PLS40792.1 hypothetical protein CYV28_14820 [Carnobacterium maltaromaticum]PLS41189.1 hypothetical protein CYV27_14890 [Carnobacterium maltaromaticum]PLS51157.1 hypothetical protein CYV29_12685 [Carnobacterium maltaromaticum]PLS52235.1 hypothetical protein CYV26_12685 [Carnobacterium maltaromaticum]
MILHSSLRELNKLLIGLNGSTNFLSRPVLLNQSFGKKINSKKSKRTLLLEFPIFLSGLNGSTNFLLHRRKFYDINSKNINYCW